MAKNWLTTLLYKKKTHILHFWTSHFIHIQPKNSQNCPSEAITHIPIFHNHSTAPEMCEICEMSRFHTSTDMTAEQIHQKGLEEVERIEGEMKVSCSAERLCHDRFLGDNQGAWSRCQSDSVHQGLERGQEDVL